MKRSTPFLAAVCALVALAGCGTDNTISGIDNGTDSAPPSAPTNVREVVRGNEVLLAWDASSDADVVGYDVYVYLPDPAREAAYVKINSATVTDEEYLISDPGSESWYRVKAVDNSGNRSSSSGAAFVDGGSTVSGGGEIPDDLPIRRQ